MNIGIIGGDSRIVELVEILVKSNNIYLYGLKKVEKLSNLTHIDELEDLIKKSDTIITSIPLSKDGIKVNAPYSEKPILVEDFFNLVKSKKIITGNITEVNKEFLKKNKNCEVIDILKLEDLTVLNSIPTAEGAIQIAMEKSNITIHNSKCLVLGFGRIGKILAKMLNGIGAKVSCEARKTADIAWIRSYGYNAIHLDNLNDYLNEYDFIFNTIPHMILDKDRLQLINKECILIDLASKPGGIDFEEAKEMGIQTEWALALPGKVAPKTSAQYIYEIIKDL